MKKTEVKLVVGTGDYLDDRKVEAERADRLAEEGWDPERILSALDDQYAAARMSVQKQLQAQAALQEAKDAAKAAADAA